MAQQPRRPHSSSVTHTAPSAAKTEVALAASGSAEPWVEALRDIQHQLFTPLTTLARRLDRLGRHETSADTRSELRLLVALCKQAIAVAYSGDVYAALIAGDTPSTRIELLSGPTVQTIATEVVNDLGLLVDARRELRVTIDERAFDCLQNVHIRADRELLRQCLFELVDNALKYSFSDTEISLEARNGRDWCALVVTSTGLPLPPDGDDRARLRGWRGDGALVTAVGTGRGLWLVDQLMHAMGGELRLRCTDGTTIAEVRLKAI